MKIVNSLLIATLFFLYSAAAPADQPADQPADIVALDGAFYTVNPEQPWAQAVAIRDGSIVYVGDNEGALAFVGPETTVGDLHGSFALPGIVTTHEHPLMVMVIRSALNLPYTEDKEKMLAAVKKYVEENPDGPLFSFGGSYESRVDIYRQDIDAIIADKPFLMIAASGHGGWVNSKALEVAGITKDAPDPIESFQRDADGTPNGYLESSASIFWMVDKLGVVTREMAEKFSKLTFGELTKYGITAAFDAGAPYSEEALYPAVAALEEKGELNVRLSAAPIAQRESMLEHAFAMLEKFAPLYHSEMFKVDTLKLHADGSPDGWTAGLIEPYADRPDSTGLTSFTPDVQKEATVRAASLGYNVHSHSIGDRTIRQTLDAFEAARVAGYFDVRLTTGHTGVVHPDDVHRFKDLNVTANTFAAKNAVPDPTWIARLGPERALRYQPMGTLLEAGARLAMSADYPTAPLNPWLQISIAMTRHDPGKGPDYQGLKQDKLTLVEAIKAYTLDGAYALKWEDIIGSIEVGKRADIIVLDRNLFNSTTDEIAEANVLATMVNGRVVHEEAVDWDPPGDPLELPCIYVDCDPQGDR